MAESPNTQPVFPFSSAPRGREILAWFPLYILDDDCEPTTNLPDEGVQGAWAIINVYEGGGFEVPDFLNACGPWFGDDAEYASDPTHWTELPAPVVAPKPYKEG